MKEFVFIFSMFLSLICHGQVFSSNNGNVDFISNAPLEIIRAHSDQLQGVLDVDEKYFAFKLYVKSFDGFNSTLQRVHFFENYLEVNSFPLAIFKGKILEGLEKGKGKYRAKGILEIHGVKVERIIDVEINISDNSVAFSTSFLVPLVDHNIDLPRIVFQKIAEEIKVNVQGAMMLKE